MVSVVTRKSDVFHHNTDHLLYLFFFVSLFYFLRDMEPALVEKAGVRIHYCKVNCYYMKSRLYQDFDFRSCIFRGLTLMQFVIHALLWL